MTGAIFCAHSAGLPKYRPPSCAERSVAMTGSAHTFLHVRTSSTGSPAIRSKRSSIMSAPCACAAAACAGSVRQATICMYLTICRGATKRYAMPGPGRQGYPFIPFRVETLVPDMEPAAVMKTLRLACSALGWCVILAFVLPLGAAYLLGLSPVAVSALIASAFVIEDGSIPIGIGLGLPVQFVVPVATSVEAGIFLGLLV